MNIQLTPWTSDDVIRKVIELIDEDQRFFISNLLNGCRINNVSTAVIFERVLAIYKCEWPEKLDSFLFDLKDLFIHPNFPSDNNAEIVHVFRKFDQLVPEVAS